MTQVSVTADCVPYFLETVSMHGSAALVEGAVEKTCSVFD
jgi:hypothetical protein